MSGSEGETARREPEADGRESEAAGVPAEGVAGDRSVGEFSGSTSAHAASDARAVDSTGGAAERAIAGGDSWVRSSAVEAVTDAVGDEARASIHAGGYGPVGAIRQFQAAAPAAQMQFVGYQPPSPFQPAMGVPHPEFRLRVPVDSRSRGSGGSSGNMTREEKVEKLRYLQGMQTGRVAVEQQHSGMESGGGVGQARGMSRQVEVGTASGSEMRAAGMEGGYSPSLSVGQTSLETTSEEENRAMEGAVLGRLQETLKSVRKGGGVGGGWRIVGEGGWLMDGGGHGGHGCARK